MDKRKDNSEIDAQRRIVKTIIEKGTKFTVTYTEKVRQKGLFGFMKQKVSVERKEEFLLKEPTLGTLDRASEVWLRMNTESVEKEGAEVIAEGFKLANAHSRDMAECIAILVLGEAYYAVEGGDDKEIERLTNLFYRAIKPSQCGEISLLINATCNLVDFVNSMRLMKMLTTTTPTKRIE